MVRASPLTIRNLFWALKGFQCMRSAHNSISLTNWWFSSFPMKLTTILSWVEILKIAAHSLIMIWFLLRTTKTNAAHDCASNLGKLSKQNWFRHVSITRKRTFHSRKQSTFLWTSHARIDSRKTLRKIGVPHTCFVCVINECASITYIFYETDRGVPNAADPVVLLLHVITSHNMRTHSLRLHPHKTYVKRNVHCIVAPPSTNANGYYCHLFNTHTKRCVLECSSANILLVAVVTAF